MLSEDHKYLVYVDLRDNSKERIRKSVTVLNDVMTALFGTNFKLAATSNDASVLTFLVKTTMNAHAINAALMSPEVKGMRLWGDPLTTSDRLMVLELGEQYSTFGLSPVDGWLNAN